MTGTTLPWDQDTSDIVLFADRNPAIFAITIALLVVATGSLLYFAVKSVGDAGRVQPPLVVIVLVLGIVLLTLTVVIALRPSTVEALAPLVGAGVGGLAGAVAQAFTARRSVDQEPKEGRDS